MASLMLACSFATCPPTASLTGKEGVSDGNIGSFSVRVPVFSPRGRELLSKGLRFSQSQQSQQQRPILSQAAKRTFSSFDEMLAMEDVVLVDFYATWCGPCKVMAGVLQEVSAQRKDLARIVKIDTEKYPRLASTHQIEALPTLVLFQKGRPIHRVEGVLSAPDLIRTIEGVLASQ